MLTDNQKQLLEKGQSWHHGWGSTHRCHKRTLLSPRRLLVLCETVGALPMGTEESKRGIWSFQEFPPPEHFSCFCCSIIYIYLNIYKRLNRLAQRVLPTIHYSVLTTLSRVKDCRHLRFLLPLSSQLQPPPHSWTSITSVLPVVGKYGNGVPRYVCCVCLTSLTWHNVPETIPCLSVGQESVSFHCQVVSHCVIVLQPVCPSPHHEQQSCF